MCRAFPAARTTVVAPASNSSVSDDHDDDGMHNSSEMRVSTFDQNVDRQLEGQSLDRIFTDKASGKDVNRPQLDAMLTFVREGDTDVVHSMDRLARKLDDLGKLVQSLTKRCAMRATSMSMMKPLANGSSPPRKSGGIYRSSQHSGYLRRPLI